MRQENRQEQNTCPGAGVGIGATGSAVVTTGIGAGVGAGTDGVTTPAGAIEFAFGNLLISNIFLSLFFLVWLI